MVTLYPITYSKQKLAAVDPDERVLHFMMAQIANDVAALQKQIMFCLNPRRGEPELPIGGARTASAVMLLGFLAGRLYEAWILIGQPAHSKAYRSYAADMSTEGREALDRVKHYFNKKNLVQSVRLKLAFHTDLATVRVAYEQFDDDQTFTDYIARETGNTHYHGAATLNACAMARLTGETDLKAGLNRLMKEIPDVARDVSSYVQAFMVVFLERYVDLDPSWATAKKNVLRFKAPGVRTVRTPYFCDTSRPRNGRQTARKSQD